MNPLIAKMSAPLPEQSIAPSLRFDAVTTRATCLLRATLAFSGLLVAGLGQAHIGSHASLAWFVLLLYSIYSIGLYSLALYRESLLRLRIWHWADVGWYAALVALTGGQDSVFSWFFIFPILVSSFRFGFAEGMAVSVVAEVSWLAVSLTEPAGSIEAQWQWLLLRAILLLALGYVIARWASFEIVQQRRLSFLREINRIPNPRFGPDRLIGASLERLRDFYKADTCLAVMSAGDAPPRILMAEDGRRGSALAGPTASVLAAELLSLPDRCAVAYSAPSRSMQWRGARVHVEAEGDKTQARAGRKQAEELARYLDAGSWVSVPLELRGASAGRLYLMSQRGRFDVSDIRLLRQAVEQLMPIVETVQLLDGLVSDAAEKERNKISLDLHDSTIQPYLGLKLGLESLSRKVAPDNVLAADLDELCKMTNDSIAELRRYVRELKGQPQERSASPLLEGVQRQVDKFGKFYGIEVDLNAAPNLNLNDRLTAEVLQMIGESLSNIGRHTDSRRVTINLSRRGEHFLAQIINHGSEKSVDWRHFTPGSITQRAAHLGGAVDVSPLPDGGTAVTVDIPL